jgi:DNA repair protein RecO (recombination protein O)
MKTESIQLTEGIVLNAILYKEYDRIITLFSSQLGLIKLFMKGTKKSHSLHSVLAAPFTIGEYYFSQGRGDLNRFQDGTLKTQNLRLRDSFECLQTASFMSDALLKSQWPGKPAPQLYYLFQNFLDKLPRIDQPRHLLPSFFLKLLRHEGLLHFSTTCSLCQTKLKEIFRYGGECFCCIHAPLGACLFNEEEEKKLLIFAYSRSFSEIMNQAEEEESFEKKIRILFEQALQEYSL